MKKAQVAVALGLLLGGASAKAADLTLTLVGQHNISNNFDPEFYEALGLGLAKNGTKLWSVGDENNFAMYKMELNGDAVSDGTSKYRKPIPLSGMANSSSTTVKCGSQTVAQAFYNAGNSGLEGITWHLLIQASLDFAIEQEESSYLS